MLFFCYDNDKLTLRHFLMTAPDSWPYTSHARYSGRRTRPIMDADLHIAKKFFPNLSRHLSWYLPDATAYGTSDYQLLNPWIQP